jgi:uncharacterized membrane protein
MTDGSEPVPMTQTRREIDLGRWITSGWKLIRGELLGYMLAALIWAVVLLIAFNITWLMGALLAGPLTAGFFLMAANHLRGGRLLMGDLFQAFGRFLPLTLASILLVIALSIGAVLCVLPALFIAGLYLFTFLLIIDRELDFWEAMETSRRIASKDYLEFTLFVLVLLVLNLAGVMALVIGVLVTIPLSFAAVTCAYNELVGLAPEPALPPSTPASSTEPPLQP